MKTRTALPSQFRKLTIQERRTWLLAHLGLESRSKTFLATQQTDLELAEIMVENAIGFFELPFGVALGLPVNGEDFDLPLATEEPSVIAAASYAARLLHQCPGGIRAGAAEPLMKGQIFLEEVHPDFQERFEHVRPLLFEKLKSHFASMHKRGGGVKNVGYRPVESLNVLEVFFEVDVRDAMGANLINTAAETVAPFLVSYLGGKKLLAILSNDASLRLAWAEFLLPFEALTKPHFTGQEMARRIALAGEIAQKNSQRAVTHNKGIMNGITALAQATGNDTRAVEAAVHSFASHPGRYRGLTRFKVQKDGLMGRIELPLALATVGGAIDVHPMAQFSLDLLGRPTSSELCSLAAALGLAQNFAALFALTGEGIQQGHMNYHNKRVEYLKARKGTS